MIARPVILLTAVNQSIVMNNQPSAVKTILLAWLIAGTLDGLTAAIVYGPVFGKITVAQLYQFIASAVQGKQAFAGGTASALLGVCFHYCIALTFTIVYFLLFPYIRSFARHKVVAGLCYGIVVWIIMNLGVLPLTQVQRAPLQAVSVIKGALILMLMIGLPISLIVYRYYRRKGIV